MKKAQAIFTFLRTNQRGAMTLEFTCALIFGFIFLLGVWELFVALSSGVLFSFEEVVSQPWP